MWSREKLSAVYAILLITSCSADYNSVTQIEQKPHRTVVYFQNGSDTEPEAELEISRDDSVVFAGSVEFNNLPDDWHSLNLQNKRASQRISIMHKNTGVRLDTLIQTTDTLTSVFLTFSYHKLSSEETKRLHKSANDAEEEAYMRKLFGTPRRFFVLVMKGPISIP